MRDSINKRSFYRVNDHVVLKVRNVDEAEHAHLMEDLDSARLRYSLATHVNHRRAERAPVLQSIRRRQPEVAAYIEHLEEQLETLALHLSQAADFQQQSVPRPVNLSATGMRYESLVEVTPGQKVELGIMLFPNQRVILAMATAVRVELPTSAPARASDSADNAGGAGNTDGTETWSVSLQFDRLNTEDEELLIKHVHAIQRKQLQAKRNLLDD